MFYVNTTLSRGEIVTYETSLSWATCVIPMFFLFFGSIFAIISLIALIVLITRIFRIVTTEIAITNKKFVVKRGLFVRNTTEQQLNKIDSVQINQGFIGRVFRYGTITINGSGLSTTSIKQISSPLILRKELQESIDTFMRRSEQQRLRRPQFEEEYDDFSDYRGPRQILNDGPRPRISDR